MSTGIIRERPVRRDLGHLVPNRQSLLLYNEETLKELTPERECGKAKLARRPVCKPQAENVEISNAPDGFIPAREFCNFLCSL